MPGFSPATPFGSRSASFGHLAGAALVREAMASAALPGANVPAAVNKWAVFRALTAAARPLALSDRTLALLNALLSFHPETALSLPAEADAADLVVFPSNKALGARAHGMAEKTIRRHLAALVEAGLILRRDSPNGKRYARRGEGEAPFGEAFGFDLSPLVVRAGEFEALAEAEKRREQALRRLREQVSLLRRDVMKLIGLGLEESRPGPWDDYRMALMELMTPVRRLAGDETRLAAHRDALLALRADVLTCLSGSKDIKATGNDGECDRHQSNSNEDAPLDLEPAVKTDRGDDCASSQSVEEAGTSPLPSLALVLEACPDLETVTGSEPLRSWRAFEEAVRLIRPMLGISADAMRDAEAVLGLRAALIAVASILQRSEHSSEALRTGTGVTVNGSPAIRSAGGYLRALTEKARCGDFHLGPMLMALIGQRLKARRGEG